MRIFGWEVNFRKAARGLQTISGTWTTVWDTFTGAWQSDVKVDQDKVVLFGAVYACVTLIASDVAKMRLRLMEKKGRIWKEVEQSPFLSVLRKPNGFQNTKQFVACWIISKLLNGNAYILKVRDNRGLVRAMYVLDPQRVTPMVADDGSIYYRLSKDNLASITSEIVVPASEIIHDRFNCLFHPLVGVSPIKACGLAATQGLKIQNNSTKFFENMSRPSGVLTAPAAISNETAARLKADFEANFSGEKIGRLLVAGDGLKYEAMHITASDAQLIEQLKWTAENVCTAFHVPPYKIGVGQTPTYANAEILNQIYYTDCLQSIIEDAECSLDEGLGLTEVESKTLGVEFDLYDLLRMDTATRYKTFGEGIKAGFVSPNWAREREDMEPVEGGDHPFLQQQNYSIPALAKRDAREDPFAPAKPEPKPEPEPEDEETAEAVREMGEKLAAPIAELREKVGRVDELERVVSAMPEKVCSMLIERMPAPEADDEVVRAFDAKLAAISASLAPLAELTAKVERVDALETAVSELPGKFLSMLPAPPPPPEFDVNELRVELEKYFA